ncbi:MAG: nicotinate (nicotinamide) nucleotide adenylyltransferase [Acidimicrobiia bacterium]|nr:nicotinate (nicotinamide) nucleotide adenylyltransferase [Acidimicrobiia bacterium]
MVKRALLGGTFDPPHLAHLVAGEAAYHALDVDVVTFVPAGAPWQKAGDGVTSASHRWHMTERAVKGVEYFEADEREVNRDGWTYTIETVRSFPRDDQVTLILGSDAAAGIPTWHEADALLDRVSVAVAERPGTDRRSVERAIGGVEWLDMPLLPVSGTQLRARAAAGGSIRFMVRESVWDYIVTNALYGPELPD